MNDVIQAIYLMQLHYASDDERNVNGFMTKRTIELDRILSIDSVMNNKYVHPKIEDAYELHMELDEFLEQWSETWAHL